MSDITFTYDPKVAVRAYLALQAELEALPYAGLSAITISVQQAARIALHVATWLREPAILEALVDGSRGILREADLAKLEQVAWATWHAHLEYVTAERRRRGALIEPKLAAQARELNTRMLALVTYHLGDQPEAAAEIGRIRGGTGHLDTASDLARLADLVDAHRERLATDTKNYRAEDADLARQIAAEIVGTVNTSDRTFRAWSDRRARAFTLLRKVYDDIRALATFALRHCPHVSAEVPSLFAAARRSPGAQKGLESLHDDAQPQEALPEAAPLAAVA